MNDNRLWNERVEPALDQMYIESETIFDSSENENTTHRYRFDWKSVERFSPAMPNGKRCIPLWAFFLPMDLYDSICKNAVKHLRTYWAWPYRTEIVYGEDSIKYMQHQMEELESIRQNTTDESEIKDIDFKINSLRKDIANNDKNKRRNDLWHEYLDKRSVIEGEFESKKITHKEFNSRINALCKEYDMTKRSRDAEKVRFTLMDYSPSSNKETFNKIKGWYQLLKDQIGNDTETDSNKVLEIAEDVCGDDNRRWAHDVAVAYLFLANYKSDKKLTTD